jgi:lysozyme family protein
MTSKRFEAFLSFILKWECVRDKHGNVIAEHDPQDPGGLTKYGIDKASHPKVDIANLTLAQATEIYFREWRACGAESMPPGLGEVFFNACVNCGVWRAHKLLHDPGTHNTADNFLDAQESFYRRLVAARVQSRREHSEDPEWLNDHPDLSKFLKGWLNRTADLRRRIKA